MKKNVALIAGLFTMALGAGTALAGGSEGSIGIGAEYQLSGEGGLSANYDMGKFHVGGWLSFSDNTTATGDDDTDVGFGGRFFYHVHSTAMSDFGVGGSVGLAFNGDRTPGMDNNTTNLFIEPGIQIRAFVASNVALSFTGGLALGLVDADGVVLTAQPVAIGGVHYYFF